LSIYCKQVGIVALNLIGIPLADTHAIANGAAHPAATPAATRDSGDDAGGLDAETATQVLLHYLC
jgi:hypothetical protein